MVSGKES